MRCAPLAIPQMDRETLARVSRQSSQITHADPRCTYGCAVLNWTIAALLDNETNPLETALEGLRSEAPSELVTALEAITMGESPTLLQTSGYVIHTLQTALHDALTTDSAEEAIVTAVNRGGDTDTVGAVTGAVAGARFGAESLPDRWLASIDDTAELRELATELTDVRIDR